MPTAPGPWPVAPDATEIHGTWLTAVQLQPLCAETATSWRPPLASTARSTRSSANAHGAGPWVMSTRTLLTTTVPRRSTTCGLAVAAKLTVPSPWPVVVESDSQSASLRASQAHSRLVATTMAPLPPGAATLAGWADALTPQRLLGAVTDVDDSRPQAPVRAATAARSVTRRIQVPMNERSTVSTAGFTHPCRKTLHRLYRRAEPKAAKRPRQGLPMQAVEQ